MPGESNPDAILGYEIIRNGKPAAFVEPDKTSEDGVTEYVVQHKLEFQHPFDIPKL